MTHRLYVDESGDHGYGSLDREDQRYLGLIGLAVDLDAHAFTLPDAIESLKRRLLPHSPDDPVVLHRKEIVQRSGPFYVLQNSEHREQFDTALLDLISNLPYVIFMVVLDKKQHFETHGRAGFDPYHLCLAMLLERYCDYLKALGRRGDVLCESRGGREDRHLKDEYRRLVEEGNSNRPANFFASALTSKELKMRKKEANVAGLQLADLLAHPAKQDVLVEYGRLAIPGSEFREPLRQAMHSHYHRGPKDYQVKGYGRLFA